MNFFRKNPTAKFYCNADGDNGQGGGGEGGGGSGGGGGGGEGGGAKWYASHNFDADTVKLIEDRKLDGVPAVVKSWVNADKMATSRNVLEKPVAGKEKEWKGWDELGAPSDPAKYVLKAPDDERKKKLGFDFDTETMSVIQKIGHEERVPLAAAQRMHDALMDHVAGVLGEKRKTGEAAALALQTELDKEWGANKDKNTELAKRAAQSLFSIDEQSTLEKIMGNVPMTKKFFELGSRMSEDHLKGGGSGGNAATAATARTERLKLEADPEFMKIFNDDRHPQRQEYVARRQKLIEIEASQKAA